MIANPFFGTHNWGMNTRITFRPDRRGFTLVELLVVIAIIGILVGLLLPAVQNVREAARRVTCLNNLKQLGLALLNFESSHRVFPASGWTTVGPGNPNGKYVGWRPMVLPYLEQGALADLYDRTHNWWEGSNAVSAAVPVPVFECASVSTRADVLSAVAKSPRPAMTFANPIAPTDYEALMGVQPGSINPHLSQPYYNSDNRFSVMHRNSRTRFADIVDGTTSTIMIVEAGGRPLVYRNGRPQYAMNNDQGIGWADSEGPFSLDGANADGSIEGGGPAAGCIHVMNRRNDNEPYSFHPGGSNVLFAGANTEFLSQSTSIKVMAAISTRDAGELDGLTDF